MGLLPLTGLSIGEAVELSVHDIHNNGSEPAAFAFTRKAKRRVIPLPPAARRILTRHLAETRPGHWLFDNGSGLPLTAHAIRKHTRNIAAQYHSLAGLCPQVLRATYADLLFKQGKSLAEVQALMGHESVLSTQRYLKPA